MNLSCFFPPGLVFVPWFLLIFPFLLFLQQSCHILCAFGVMQLLCRHSLFNHMTYGIFCNYASNSFCDFNVNLAFLFSSFLFSCKLRNLLLFFFFFFLSPVSKMWAKKNSVGKEQVAKLVDDTYRSVLETAQLTTFSSYSFAMLQINVVCKNL